MVDPRIYRAFLVLVAFAVIIFGFSLQNSPHGLGTSIAPGDFFADAQATTKTLASEYPDRSPGSQGDQKLAAAVASGLRQGFSFAWRSLMGAEFVFVIDRHGHAVIVVLELGEHAAARRRHAQAPSVAG